MKIYKAGTRYFSTYQEAKTYREKYFSSARWIETIDVTENKVKEGDIVKIGVNPLLVHPYVERLVV